MGGNLSSYTFTLMAIYFMQVHMDVRLPCLPTSAFKDDADEEDGKARIAAARSFWTCRLPVAHLLSRFFWFYAFDFAWGLEVVSVRLGHRLYASDQLFTHLRGRWVTRLHVEDPCE